VQERQRSKEYLKHPKLAHKTAPSSLAPVHLQAAQSWETRAWNAAATASVNRSPKRADATTDMMVRHVDGATVPLIAVLEESALSGSVH
jgi:hypothetical protein